MPRISRQICALTLLLFATPAGAEPPSLKVGMSTALTGPAQGLGLGMREGVEAYFARVNREGGIAGRKLELIALDDQYEPAQTGPNVRRLIDSEHVVAIVGNVGTPTAVVTVPIVNEKRVPLFGAFTGAGVLRKDQPDRYVFNVRASYANETAEMVRGLLEDRKLDPRDIAFFAQDDAYGDAGYNGALKALAAHGFTETSKLPLGRYTRNTLDVEDGLAHVLDPRMHPKAVIMVGTAKPCAKFISLARKSGLHAIFANVSFVGSAELLKELGQDAEGVVVTQVVPHWSENLPVLEQYRDSGLEPNFVSLEGFVVGRAFTEVLRRMGGDYRPEHFVETAESGVEIDLGLGKPQALSKTRHGFSSSVWPTVIRHGAFQAFKSWRELNVQ
ncbi:MAG TPA: ABC transporter substrate-binding protein [Polyangiaceae bacterium]|nr:ABC transporter substrate-binding protein [Polyangiaceae bacterium]